MRNGHLTHMTSGQVTKEKNMLDAQGFTWLILFCCKVGITYPNDMKCYPTNLFYLVVSSLCLAHS